MNLLSLAVENIQTYGEYVALIFEGMAGTKQFTNIELYKKIMSFSQGLKNLGLKTGDKIVVILPNCPEVFIADAAVWSFGGILIPLLFLLTDKEINFILNDCQPKVIISNTMFKDKILKAVAGINSIEKIILVDEKMQDTEERILSFADVYAKIAEEKITKENVEIIPDEIEDNDLAVLLYTSGTTGNPKGVMLSHKNLKCNLDNLRATRVRYGFELENASAITALPMSHAYGLFLLAGSWISATTIILLEWFDTIKVFQLIEKYKIKGMAGVPTMYIYMIHDKDIDKYDLSSLEICASAAAPLPREIKKKLKEKLNLFLVEGYGLTESSAPVTITPKNMTPEQENSVGLPIDNVEVAIFSDDDKQLPAGEIGEVCVRGGNVMLGYYKNPQKTNESIRNNWLHTGDMGYLDKDGFLYLMERKRDLIIRGGFNIFPKDVEEVLHQHPKVMEAAVVGIPHESLGEEVKAFVVLKIGEKVSAEELIELCQQNLAKYKCPKSIEFRPFLPKNHLGKILKKELRGNL